MKKILKSSVMVVALFLVVSIMFASCGKSSSSDIVGTWAYSVNGTEIISFKFTDGGKMTVKTAGITTLECDYKVKDGKLIYSVAGQETESKYTIDGNKLTMNYLATSYTLEKAK